MSIHRLDEAIDTGPLLVQRRVEVTPADTALSLYLRLEAAMVDLFVSQWASLKDNLVAVQNQEGLGTHHWGRELGRLKALDLDETMTMRAAINRLRACTFEPHPGGEFTENGRRYQIRIQIEQVDPCD